MAMRLLTTHLLPRPVRVGTMMPFDPTELRVWSRNKNGKPQKKVPTRRSDPVMIYSEICSRAPTLTSQHAILQGVLPWLPNVKV
ncbi:hypothetical protein CLAFUW4_05033 [Fulvia fulva]|uniref:Uncharacterized protein n=1 Tax=Passalora fulva TaxID=5499 RepID=A0A9Q8PID8_PASFU|nr:uncharacterized protein CLAFUR5_11874 [Fulvia fulva]KAK4626983.1 hypothetical protein CLAFUR4_05019 [Fulvia fulva]KAK4628312.1 hypothetical protein CLAFUR0_05023 [Fulvia fulva]UJO22987.1 hypothetical protein CLAFUR5_11874 [Fulvia fulva]WPV13366.1 hypothetical protein CLAFUW4_05033 [Fulvia fulva]WPV28865.1 hypothetical protein CLAFUW7_05027 [Fulvia fulva]